MKFLLILSMSLMCEFVFSTELTFRPIGTFYYNGIASVTKKRNAETVGHISQEGKNKIAKLKAEGFLCVRKNQELTICQKTITNIETPESIQKAVDNYLKDAKFVFSGSGDPVIVHDGANTEWLINESVQIGSQKISAYKIVKNSKDLWFLSFPVSEDQAIAQMILENDSKLGLPLVLETKEGLQTVGYFITAGFIN